MQCCVCNLLANYHRVRYRLEGVVELPWSTPFRIPSRRIFRYSLRNDSFSSYRKYSRADEEGCRNWNGLVCILRQ